MIMKEMSMRDNYIKQASEVLQRLEGAGFEAYLVGGCVREALRAEAAGAPSISGAAKYTDLDVTTNALPEETCRIFSDDTVIETGIKHGTVTVLITQDRIPVEITTYRTDGNYSDGRHPDQVQFVRSLEEDLARRDFTINAMAMDLRGEVKDPFGGQEDLAQGTIRSVGNPEARFREDGLRILRALRFAAVLDFRIEPKTEAALFQCAPLLKNISAECIYVELKKLVCGPGAGDVIRRYVDILGVIIPELTAMKGFAQNNPYHKYDVLEHCIRAMETVRGTGGPAAPSDTEMSAPAAAGSSVPAYLKLAALFHDVGKPRVYTEDENGIGHFYGHPQAGSEVVSGILSRLKTDRAAAQRIETLIHYHDLVFQEDERLLKRWMNRYTPEVLLEILELKRADNIATGNVSQELLDKFDRIEGMIRKIWQEAQQGQTCFCMKDLAVGGRDLIEAGIPEGPQIGEVLQKLLDEVIDGSLPNDRQALLEAAARVRQELSPALK